MCHDEADDKEGQKLSQLRTVHIWQKFLERHMQEADGSWGVPTAPGAPRPYRYSMAEAGEWGGGGVSMWRADTQLRIWGFVVQNTTARRSGVEPFRSRFVAPTRYLGGEKKGGAWATEVTLSGARRPGLGHAFAWGQRKKRKKKTQTRFQ